MKITDTQQKITLRVLLDEEFNTIFLLAKTLVNIDQESIVISHEERQTLKKIGITLVHRIQEQDIDYCGKKYQIYARGKRSLRNWFRRYPDIFVGEDTGRNFLDACNHYFTCIQYTMGAYNIKKNTLAGHELYDPENKDTTK